MVVIKSIKEDSSTILSLVYKDRENGDLVIINKDKRYNVHKTILCHAIPYFDKMLSSEMKEATSKEIILDHPSEIFHMIIDWAYCQPIEITGENVLQLYHLANYMNITNLALECLFILFDTFSDKPMLEIDYWRRQVAVIDIGKIVDRYIGLNFRAIISTKMFLTYDVDTVDYIVNCTKLDINEEMEVFDAIIRWVEGSSEERLVHLPKLLAKMHWSSIKQVEFIKKIIYDNYIKTNKETHPIILAAFGLIYLRSPDSAQSLNLKIEPRPLFRSTSHLCCLTNVSDFKKKVEILDDSENVRTICTLDYDSSLIAQRLQHFHISEHLFSDYIIQIDWKNRRWNHFKNDNKLVSKLFEHIYEFERNPGSEDNVCLKKGSRLIKLAPFPSNCDYLISITPYKDYFLLFGRVSSTGDTIILFKFDPMENIWETIMSDKNEAYEEYPTKDYSEIEHVFFYNYLILFLGEFWAVFDIDSKSWSRQNKKIRQSALETYDDTIVFCIHNNRLLIYNSCRQILREYMLGLKNGLSLIKDRKIKGDLKSTELFSVQGEFLSCLNEK